MKAKPSKLSWKRFAVFQWTLKSVQFPESEGLLEIAEMFSNYSIDVDFDHLPIDDNTLQVFVDIRINQDPEGKEEHPGYSIRLEAAGQFDITPINEHDDAEKLQPIVASSTVNMMIGRIRTLIYQLTASGYLGSYELPSIDLGDLFAQKARQLIHEEGESE